MKTAEQYWENVIEGIFGNGSQHHMTKDNFALCMIEFAKLHVKEALSVASKTPYPFYGTARIYWNSRNETDIKTILNAYPETNIK